MILISPALNIIGNPMLLLLYNQRKQREMCDLITVLENEKMEGEKKFQASLEAKANTIMDLEGERDSMKDEVKMATTKVAEIGAPIPPKHHPSKIRLSQKLGK